MTGVGSEDTMLNMTGVLTSLSLQFSKKRKKKKKTIKRITIIMF